MSQQRPRCQVCDKEENVLKRCTKCRCVFYCSRECQITDWSNHKTACISCEPALPVNLLTVRLNCNKQKTSLVLNYSASSDRIIQNVADAAKVQADKMKIVCRGKCLNADNIKDNLKANDLLLIIGEVMENEDGLVKEDIDVIMQQVGAERNAAVKALRASDGDVIQAIIDIGNKS
ncbi:hypothetical protein CAPTEDRAFT_178444 [Capitella teleta]|uniref:MYND-type domain-containing protein n=1 Tax=Capitella teleta TaxID=283909 RepID=R7T7E9_CAPTE|nr:hypothetical protein CAPTEDRAFT_178444 [Capitella teleta]|eukprot:ELT89338.1 hypothetical protein CAPTEDRAFT_178444 [Capitella teleta]